MKYLVSLLVLSFLFAESFAQSNPNAKPDTSSSYYDKDAFDKELRELFGDFASDDLKKRTGTKTESSTKSILEQVKELMLAARNNYEGFYTTSGSKTDKNDIVYATSYKFNDAISNEVRKEKGTYVSYLAVLGTYKDAKDGAGKYEEWLAKLKNELSGVFTADENPDKYITKFDPVDVRPKGRSMYLLIKPVYDKYALILMVRSDLSYPEIAKDGPDFDYDPSSWEK